MTVNPDLAASCGRCCGVCATPVAGRDNKRKYWTRRINSRGPEEIPLP